MAGDLRKKPQVWHGKKHRVIWSEPITPGDAPITTIYDDANSYTYCDRDDAFGYDDDDWQKILDKMIEKGLEDDQGESSILITEDIQ